MDKNEAWGIWSQRIPADTTLEQAFKAGYVAGQETHRDDEFLAAVERTRKETDVPEGSNTGEIAAQAFSNYLK